MRFRGPQALKDSLETPDGDDRWRFGTTNPLPGINIQEGAHLGNWYPRLTFSGPIERGRFWFSDSISVQHTFAVVKQQPSGANTYVLREELRKIFRDLRSGSAVIVLGATGGSYQRIYKRVVEIANAGGLKDLGLMSALRGIGNYTAARIKEAQHRVYLYLENVVGPDALSKSKAWPDYWNPRPSPKSRPIFALRIFRRGRWPTRRSDS